jgi:hypothetical protein
MRLLAAVVASVLCMPWHYLMWIAWGWVAQWFGPAQPSYTFFATACLLVSVFALLVVGAPK